jgi:hypothetical protein
VQPRIPIGSELWALFYDLEKDERYAKLVGIVTGYRKGAYQIDRVKWCEDGYPLFRSEADAKVWIAENPLKMPTIKA